MSNKTKIFVDGKEIEVDIDTLEKDEYGIHVESSHSEGLNKSKTFKKIKRKVKMITPLICLLGFFLIFFLYRPNGEVVNWCWTIFLLIPVVNLIFDISSKTPKGAFMSIISLVTIASIVLIGIFAHGWYWSWCLIFIIPICSILLDQ